MTKPSPTLREVARKLHSERGYRLPCGDVLVYGPGGDGSGTLTTYRHKRLHHCFAVSSRSFGALRDVFAALAKYPTAEKAKGRGK